MSTAASQKTIFSKILIATDGSDASMDAADYAEDKDVDLIVVGTRGRSGFKKLLLGGVATNVVTYAHCPVMVVR